MKTNQNHNRGSVKLSDRSQNSKNSPVARTSKQAILQNSSNKHAGSNSQNSGYYDSPYKNSLSEIKCVPPSADSISDFKTPNPVRNKSKLLKKVTSYKRKTNTSGPKRANKGNSIIKFTKDNFGRSDVDPNHLQMALALSKSTYVLENPGRPENVEDTPNFFSIEKIAKVKTTLERYGFKSDKPMLNASNLKTDRIQGKRSKTSKFHFITPILKTRKAEERELLITSKISLILEENNCSPISESQIKEKENTLFSTFLREFCNEENVVFGVNKLSETEICNFGYYNKKLNINPTKYHCGCLLRNWDDVPGREKSPTRNEPLRSIDVYRRDENYLTKIKSMNLDECGIDGDDFEASSLCRSPLEEYNVVSHNSPDKISRRQSISPDLFDSDDESDFSTKAYECIDGFSQLSAKSPLKGQSSAIPQNDMCPVDLKGEGIGISNCVFSRNSGVLHFESYNNLNELSQEVCAMAETLKDKTNREISVQKQSPVKCNKKNYELPDISDQNSGSCKDEGTIRRKEMNTNLIHSSPHGEINSSFDSETMELNYEEEPENFFDVNTRISIISKDTTDYELVECDLTQDASSDDDRIEHIQSSYDGMVKSVDKSAQNNLKENRGGLYENIPNKKLLSDVGSSGCDDKIEVRHVRDIEYVDNILEKSATRDLHSADSFCSSSFLNVTDYVNKVLNNDFSTNQGCTDQNSYEDFSKANLTQSSSSQESILISDEELNYSSMQSYTENHKEMKNKTDIYEISDSDGDINEEKQKNDADICNLHSGSFFVCCQITSTGVVGSNKIVLKNKYASQNSLLVNNRITELKNKVSLTRESLARAFFEESFIDVNEYNVTDSTDTQNLNANDENEPCQKQNHSKNKDLQKSGNENTITPEKTATNTEYTKAHDFVIKTKNVTPMINYDELDTPTIARNLEKFGVKPLKRQRGVKLLKYLYDCTHPFVDHKEINEISSDEEDQKVIKKRKNTGVKSTGCNLHINSVNITTACKLNEGNLIVTNFLERENEYLIFERKKSRKIPSCQVPLQIVWHNFICSNPEIEENILTYEPLQLEALHLMLKEQSGCKFHIQDLTTFLDKKCVTIRTSQPQEGKKEK